MIRTVIVEGTSTPVGAWATEFGLADRSAAEQALDADPDGMEYPISLSMLLEAILLQVMDLLSCHLWIPHLVLSS